ncbi:unnamed protein product [Cylindrotheca closterium]|uniref:Uncharacterized protein n=1 Tax=Cylindrotheca closterium TaxID=2856 RepID=A0AAD2JH90_9STRA|nr:unnamed protein product [Cylindrotheca closterium]
MPSMLSRPELSRRPRKLYNQSSMKNSSGKLSQGSPALSTRSSGSAAMHSNSSSGGSSPKRSSYYYLDSSTIPLSIESTQIPRVESETSESWGHFVDM